MQQVFVLDNQKQPLMPCHPAHARKLLKAGKAAVYRLYPFTIILKYREGGTVQPIELKFDPGSRTTGIALIGHFEQQGCVVLWAANLNHRGWSIVKRLADRRSLRRGRRNRKTRYRQARFNNRLRGKDWFPPSLRSRIDNVIHWAQKLTQLCSVTSITTETVRFDMQKLQNPEISGIEYQQGELAGYEVREYLLEKWGRQCVYCGKQNVPLEIEHIIPRSQGGSNRVSNLALSCRPCNQKKGNKPLAEFVKDKQKTKSTIERCGCC